MQPHLYWFILAFACLIVEMTTGTFYFLALSISLAMGGLAAQVGFYLPEQFAVAGVFAVISTMLLWRMKKTRRAAPDPGLDAGQPVKVLAWKEDGGARVHYRGAEWDAETESPDAPREGTFYIKAIQGSKLILTQEKPQ